MSQGRFITLEGPEGAGKSTLLMALQSELEARGQRVTRTREPGGTPLAERLRTVLLERDSERMSPAAETLLMFAARSVHVDNLIRPAIARGDWVLCDRFTDATYAYQGGGRGVPQSFIDALAAATHADCWPDRTLLLDLPVELGLERVRRRNQQVDRFEQEDLAFFKRIRTTYCQRAASDPQRFRIIDAAQPAADVLLQALDGIAEWLAPR